MRERGNSQGLGVPQMSKRPSCGQANLASAASSFDGLSLSPLICYIGIILPYLTGVL